MAVFHGKDPTVLSKFSLPEYERNCPVRLNGGRSCTRAIGAQEISHGSGQETQKRKERNGLGFACISICHAAFPLFPFQFLPFRVAGAESAATAMSREDTQDRAAAESGAMKDAPSSSLSAACAAALARRLAPSAQAGETRKLAAAAAGPARMARLPRSGPPPTGAAPGEPGSAGEAPKRKERAWEGATMSRALMARESGMTDSPRSFLRRERANFHEGRGTSFDSPMASHVALTPSASQPALSAMARQAMGSGGPYGLQGQAARWGGASPETGLEYKDSYTYKVEAVRAGVPQEVVGLSAGLPPGDSELTVRAPWAVVTKELQIVRSQEFDNPDEEERRLQKLAALKLLACVPPDYFGATVEASWLHVSSVQGATERDGRDEMFDTVYRRLLRKGGAKGVKNDKLRLMLGKFQEFRLTRPEGKRPGSRHGTNTCWTLTDLEQRFISGEAARGCVTGPWIPASVPDAESYLSYLEATPGCSTAAERLCTDLAYGRAMGLRLVSAEAVSDVVAGSGLRKSSAGDSQARVAPEPWIVEQLEPLATGDTAVPGGVVGLDYVRITLYLAKSGMRGRRHPPRGVRA